MSDGHSVTALSKLTGADRKTIDKAIVRAKVKPSGMVAQKPVYRLEDIQAALAATPNKTLRDELFIEQIRKARIVNDRLEGKLILQTDVAAHCRAIFGALRPQLEQKMRNEIPTAVAGLDPAQARIYLTRCLDQIIAAHEAFAEKWGTKPE